MHSVTLWGVGMNVITKKEDQEDPPHDSQPAIPSDSQGDEQLPVPATSPGSGVPPPPSPQVGRYLADGLLQHLYAYDIEGRCRCGDLIWVRSKTKLYKGTQLFDETFRPMTICYQLSVKVHLELDPEHP